MAKSDAVLIVIGGGELSEARPVLDEFLKALAKFDNAHLVVMTVATDEPKSAAVKYRSLFRGNSVKHVSIIDISQRDDAFEKVGLNKAAEADAFFFTGGDQLNVTTLMGGSPLHTLIQEKFNDGAIIAGTSAGAAMMSSTMIVSGGTGNPPMVGGIEFGPGMNLIGDTVIDSHFSQRSRHGRLLTAVAHHPQSLGIGIDERTAMIVRRNEFRVVGEGVVTVVDGSQMRHCDLPYRKKGEAVGMFGADIHVLPASYKFNFKTRRPVAPALSKVVGG